MRRQWFLSDWLVAMIGSVAGMCLAFEMQAAEATNRSALATGTVNPLDDKCKLSIGDRVSYRIVEDKEDPKLIVVSDSGEVELPYLGRMAAADKTCKELAAEIKVELEKKYYYHATVVLGVDLLSKTRGRVYLFGQIKAAGSQEIAGDEIYTLSKAILRAGGFTDFADKKHVKLTRKGPAGKEADVQVVDISEVLEKGKPEKDLVLQSGDMIYVPGRLVNF